MFYIDTVNSFARVVRSPPPHGQAYICLPPTDTRGTLPPKLRHPAPLSSRAVDAHCQLFKSLLLIALGDSPTAFEEEYEYCSPLLEARDPALLVSTQIARATGGGGCVHSSHGTSPQGGGCLGVSRHFRPKAAGMWTEGLKSHIFLPTKYLWVIGHRGADLEPFLLIKIVRPEPPRRDS